MSGTYRDDKPHLWDSDPPGNRAGAYDSDGEHEGRCTVNSCHARITIDPSNGTEYGHRYGCPHRPDSLPNTNGSGLRDVEDYTCAVCGRGDFPSKNSLDSHLGAAHDNACRECGAEFSTADERDDHFAHEHGEDPQQCPFCDQWFVTPESRNAHFGRSHGYICRECWSEFPTADERDTHKARQHGEDPQQCPVPTCGKWFGSGGARSVHLTRAHDNPCPECGEEFAQEVARDHHISFVHEDARAVCTLCSKGFETADELARHNGSAHNNACQQCAQEFDTGRDLRVHEIRTHVGVEPEFCPTCDKPFETAQGVSNHIKAHDNPCRECGQEFETDRDRLVHTILEHTDADEVVECPRCSDPFETETKMKAHHQRAHGERLVEMMECSLDGCDGTFEKNKSSRKYCDERCAALDRETERETHQCAICGEDYEVTPGQAKKRTTCGAEECSNEYQSRRFEKTCIECGSEFRNSFGTMDCDRCWDCRSDDAPESTQPGAAEEASSGGVAGD